MRTFIRKILQKFNYDIVKFHPPFRKGNVDQEELFTELKWLQQEGFKTIIDVGANEGQFSERMRLLFPNANIYAFEPLPQTFTILKQNFEGDTQFNAFNKGVGNEQAVLTINANEATASSSLLPMTDLHTSNFDYARKTKEVSIEVDTLDNLLVNKELAGPVLLKIDVQGFEDKVIQGAKAILFKADLVLIELTFEELYRGQPLFDDIYLMMKQAGFKYCGNTEQLKEPATNKILQADGIFRKIAN